MPSTSRPASQVPQCCHSVRDGGAVTGVGGRDSGHSHCGEWRPDAVCPGRCEEWLAFNASVRRAGEQKGRLSSSSRGGLERDGDDAPRSRVGSLPSSEAETIRLPEGRLATLERGGDAGRGRGSRWEPSSKTEITPQVRGGCGWAACWASLSPFFSPRLEGGRRPSWTQMPNMCFAFLE